MRQGMGALFLVCLVQGCACPGPTLSPSHGVMVDVEGLKHQRGPANADDPVPIEVVVDAADPSLKQEVIDATTAAFGACKSIRLVDGNAAFVLRIVTTKDAEQGFDKQEPLRLEVLVVSPRDEDPLTLSHLREGSCLTCRARCLRRQAPELCRLFVAATDVSLHLALGMKEDSP